MLTTLYRNNNADTRDKTKSKVYQLKAALHMMQNKNWVCKSFVKYKLH